MSDPQATDPSLLLRIRDERDGQAWSRFSEIYVPLIYGFARKRGLQDSDAADVTQEVLRAVNSAIKQLDYDPTKGSFRSWLFTVTRNKYRHKLDQQQRIGNGAGGTTAMEQLLKQEDPDQTLEEAWEVEYEQRLFHWAAGEVRAEVQPTTWEAFHRVAVEGQKANEVASELGMTVAAVYLAKSRVIQRLKARISELQID